MVFFSVIIPFYNRAEIIDISIDSVLNQTYPWFEIILIDDGSTDSSKKVVSSYSDSRIKYFYKNNEERSKARNYGVSKAKGDFICFLDSDDIFYENHLKLIAQKIESTKGEVGLYHTIIKKKNNDKFFTENWFIGLNSQEVVTLLIKGKSLFMNGICVSASILESNKFPVEFNYWEDQHLWIRILAQHTFHSINEVTSQWNVGALNSTSDIFTAKSVKNLDKYLRCIDNLQNTPEVKKTSWIDQREFEKLKIKKASDFIYQNRKLNLLLIQQYFTCLKYLNFVGLSKMLLKIFFK